MQVDDITRLVKYKMSQHGRKDPISGEFLLLDHQVDAVAVEVAGELSLRFTRPIVTFTRADVIEAAKESGFEIGSRMSDAAGQVLVPLDSCGEDIYPKLHTLIDWFVRKVLNELPELRLQRQLGAERRHEQG